MSGRGIDPRVQPLIEQWMSDVHMGDFVYELKRLAKKRRREAWARVSWNLEDKAVIFEWGPTVGLSDDDLEAIVVHEVMHGVFHQARQVHMGSMVDEQMCNVFAKLFVPGSSRPFKLIADVKPSWAEFSKEYFDDEDREALLEAMPHLIIRLPERLRNVVCSLYYDGKSLRDIAAERAVHHKTIERDRDEAIAALQAMMLAGGE